MKQLSKSFICIVCLSLVCGQYVNGQARRSTRPPVFTSKRNYSVVEEENIGKIYNPVWSTSDESKSSRLLHYKTQKEISGKIEDVLVSKQFKKDIFLGNGWLTTGKQAFVKAKYFDGPPYQVYEIYNLNGKLLSTVQFNKPNKFGWDGPYKKTIWTVKPYFFFDDGQYVGIEYNSGVLHFVNPPKNVYKEIPIFNPVVGLEEDTEVSGSQYNPQNQDIFIYLWAKSRWDVKEKKFAYVCLLINNNGNVLWRREKPTMTWSKMSPDGKYVVLFTVDKGKDFEGDVEIIDREGNTISTINTRFSVGMDNFSEDGNLIGFLEEYKRIKIFSVQSGELINTINITNETRFVEEFAINNKNNLLVVLGTTPPAVSDGKCLVSVYDLNSGSRVPVWEYDMGSYNRKSKNFVGGAHVSISGNGEEISAFSNGVYKKLKLDRN